VAAVAAPAPAEVRLADVTGREQPVLAADGRRGTVLFFVLPDCPVANAYAPEISRLARAFAPQGVRSYVVYADPELPARAARQHAADYAYACPAVRDPAHRLVALAQATKTPEAALFDAHGRLRYRGRIDDRAVRPGLKKPEPEVRDLQAAVADLLAGRLEALRRTEAVGCYIPARPETNPPAAASPSR
jgi:hypothetical protein